MLRHTPIVTRQSNSVTIGQRPAPDRPTYCLFLVEGSNIGQASNIRQATLPEMGTKAGG
ncbi:MAG: hypothetical protein PSY12_05545 [bacterium]|nr:hypothetical protein [bacterium]